ncbi:hypothetical protein WA158_007967 [Blastocystis sp. Blastoise]
MQNLSVDSSQTRYVQNRAKFVESLSDLEREDDINERQNDSVDESYDLNIQENDHNETLFPSTDPTFVDTNRVLSFNYQNDSRFFDKLNELREKTETAKQNIYRYDVNNPDDLQVLSTMTYGELEHYLHSLKDSIQYTNTLIQCMNDEKNAKSKIIDSLKKDNSELLQNLQLIQTQLDRFQNLKDMDEQLEDYIHRYTLAMKNINSLIPDIKQQVRDRYQILERYDQRVNDVTAKISEYDWLISEYNNRILDYTERIDSLYNFINTLKYIPSVHKYLSHTPNLEEDNEYIPQGIQSQNIPPSYNASNTYYTTGPSYNHMNNPDIITSPQDTHEDYTSFTSTINANNYSKPTGNELFTSIPNQRPSDTTANPYITVENTSNMMNPSVPTSRNMMNMKNSNSSYNNSSNVANNNNNNNNININNINNNNNNNIINNNNNNNNNNSYNNNNNNNNNNSYNNNNNNSYNNNNNNSYNNNNNNNNNSFNSNIILNNINNNNNKYNTINNNPNTINNNPNTINNNPIHSLSINTSNRFLNNYSSFPSSKPYQSSYPGHSYTNTQISSQDPQCGCFSPSHASSSTLVNNLVNQSNTNNTINTNKGNIPSSYTTSKNILNSNQSYSVYNQPFTTPRNTLMTPSNSFYQTPINNNPAPISKIPSRRSLYRSTSITIKSPQINS